MIKLILLSILLAAGACNKLETLVDENQKFAALDGASEFMLASVPLSVQKLVVNFYAPDCPPCEKELPALKKFSAFAAKGRSVVFVSIGSSLQAIAGSSTSGSDPPSAADIKRGLEAFRKKFALNYPQYIAPPAALKAWRITGYPETFIFQRLNGKLILEKKIISEVNFELLAGDDGKRG